MSYYGHIGSYMHESTHTANKYEILPMFDKYREITECSHDNHGHVIHHGNGFLLSTTIFNYFRGTMITFIIGLVAGLAIGYLQRDRIFNLIENWRDRFADDDE